MIISKVHQDEDVLPWSPHAEGISEMHPQETHRETSSHSPYPLIVTPQPKRLRSYHRGERRSGEFDEVPAQ